MGLEILVAIGIAAAVFILGIRVITEYERGVVFRFGRFNGIKEAGLRWIIPGIDRMVRISLREIVMDVPEQDVITRDNVSVKVNAVLYFRVLHPDKAVIQIQVENYLYGTSQLAQTTLRSICGQAELDELLAERESINQKLQEIIDLQTEPWGVKVRAVELKKIDLATEMQRPIAKQAEAERAKRSKVIHAEGELQAAERLAEAARVLASEEVALQLRYLQTLSKIATEHNSTTIFPVPIDILLLPGRPTPSRRERRWWNRRLVRARRGGEPLLRREGAPPGRRRAAGPLGPRNHRIYAHVLLIDRARQELRPASALRWRASLNRRTASASSRSICGPKATT
jgi:regulator of protease activity HflC (stomatin/prohibitin superfamily)